MLSHLPPHLDRGLGVRQGAFSEDRIAGVNVFTKRKASTAVESVIRDWEETFAPTDRGVESHAGQEPSLHAPPSPRRVFGIRVAPADTPEPRVVR